MPPVTVTCQDSVSSVPFADVVLPREAWAADDFVLTVDGVQKKTTCELEPTLILVMSWRVYEKLNANRSTCWDQIHHPYYLCYSDVH